MIGDGKHFIEHDGTKTVVLGPLHLADGSGNVLKRNQRRSENPTGKFFHEGEQRLIVRARHGAGELGLDQVGPPAGKLRQHDMLFNTEPVIIVAHPVFDIPKAAKHRSGTRRQQRTRAGNLSITRKVDIRVKVLVIKLERRF